MANKFNIVAELQLRGPSNVRDVVKKLQKQLNNVNVNVNIKINPQALQTLAKLQKTLKTLSQGMSTAGGSTNKLTAAANKNAKAVASTTANLNQAASAAHSFGKQSALAVKRFAAFSIGAGMMYGLANAIKDGTKAAIAFERQFVKISQVTGQSMKSLGALERQIGSLSKTLGVASAELVDVARVMSQTGLSARDVAKSLKVLAQSSLAPTFKDMKNTAEGAIAIMRQFGVTADGLAGKLGAINALAGKFAVESQDLIFAVRRAGGAFKAAGGELEELLALFTSVRATTRESAETIATGFRTIFTRMQRPKTIEFLRSAGVELQNLEGNFVGPFEAVKRLSKALKTLETTDPRFQKIVEELGGFRQVSKVIPLIQQFGTAQKALTVAMRGQDSIAKDAATAQQTLAVQIVKVREQFLSLFREVAGSDTFKNFASVALNIAKAFLNLGDSLKPVIPLLAAFGTFKLASLGTQFLGGFMGGFKGGGGASGMGQRMGGGKGGGGGQSATAAATKQIQALTSNTQSITKLTVAVNKLSYSITKMGMASSVGGRTFRKGKPTYGPGFATGGIVPGTGFGDTVPAMLEPGEFVIRKSSVKKYGAQNISRMNKGGVTKPGDVSRSRRLGGGAKGESYADGRSKRFGKRMKGGAGKAYAFDFDDTLAVSDAVVKEGAEDPFEEFRGKKGAKFVRSAKATKIAGMARTRATRGHDIYVVTARPGDKSTRKSINHFMRGIGVTAKDVIGVGGSPGPGDTAQKKAQVLAKLKKQYGDITFLDDDDDNILAASKVKGVKAIKARKAFGGAVKRYARGGTGPGPNVAGSQVGTPRRPERRDEVMRRRKLGREGRKKEKAGRGLEGGTEEHPILFGHAMGVSGFVTTGGDKGSFTPGKWQDNLLNITGSAAANDPGVKRYRGDEKGKKTGVIEKRSYPIFSPREMNLKKDADVNAAIRDGGAAGMTKAVEDSIASVGSLLQDFNVKKGSGANAAAKMVKDKDSFHTLLGYVTEGVIEGLSGARVGGGQVGFDIPNIMGKGKDGLEALYSKKAIREGVGEIKYSSTKLAGTTKAKSGLIHKIKGDILGGGHVMDAIGLAGPPFKAPGGKKKKRAATGGTSGSSDTIPALLTPGEFVVNKKSSQRIGYSNLHAMNKGQKVQGFAKGGPVEMAAGGEAKITNPEALTKYANTAQTTMGRIIEAIKNRLDEADDYVRMKRVGKEAGIDTKKVRKQMKEADVAGGKGPAGAAARVVMKITGTISRGLAKVHKTTANLEKANDGYVASLYGLDSAVENVTESTQAATTAVSQSAQVDTSVDLSGKRSVGSISHEQKFGGAPQPLGGFAPVGGGAPGTPGVLVPGGGAPQSVTAANPKGMPNKLQRGIAKLGAAFGKFMPTTTKLTAAIVNNTKTVATSTASAAKQKWAGRGGRGAGGSMPVRSQRGGEKRGTGEMAMMMMALPTAIDATVGTLGIQNKTFKELISVSQQLIMTMATLSMLQGQFGGSLKGPMKALKRGVFKKWGSSGLKNLKKFAKLGKAAAGVGLAFAAAGMVVSHFGKKMQTEAIAKAETAKTEAESQQALADYQGGERVKAVGSGIGTGGAIGAAVGQIAIPIPIVGALIGGIVGGIVGGLAAYFMPLYSDNSAIIKAMNRGRQARILSSMDKTLKRIQTEGVDSKNAGKLLVESQNLNRNISGAVGAEQAGELAASGRGKAPEIRTAIESIISASDGFDDFSTKFGGIGMGLVKELSVLEGIPFDELKKEFEEQAALSKKLNDAKKAETEALKAQRDLTGEMYAFRDALKNVTNEIKGMSGEVNQLQNIVSGGDVGAGATFGGAGVQGDIFTRAAAGEKVDQGQLSEAINQTAPNEQIAKEAQSVADLSRELPDALLAASKAAGGSGDKIGPELKKALDARGIGGTIADVMATKLTNMASGRQKSEGSLGGDIMDDPRKIASELFGSSSKEILTGLKQIADQIIATQVELNNMMNVRNSMEQKYSQARINILKKDAAGRDMLAKLEDDSFTGPSYDQVVRDDLSQQSIMLGKGGVRPGQDMSDMAVSDVGDVESMGRRLATIDAATKAEQARIKTLRAGSTEHAAATQKINDLGQKGQKLAGTLSHVAESGARLAAAQSEAAKLGGQRKAKTGMMTDIAFSNSDEMNTWDSRLTGAATLSAQANLGGGAAGNALQGGQGMLPQEMIKQGKSGEKLAKEGLSHLRFLAQNNLKFTDELGQERDPNEIIKEITRQQMKATLKSDPQTAARMGIKPENIDAMVDAQIDKSQNELEAIDRVRKELEIQKKAAETLAERQRQAVMDANIKVEQAVITAEAGIVIAIAKLAQAQAETKKVEAQGKFDKATAKKTAAEELAADPSGVFSTGGKFDAQKAKDFEREAANIEELRSTEKTLQGQGRVSALAGTQTGRAAATSMGSGRIGDDYVLGRRQEEGKSGDAKDYAKAGIMAEAVRYEEETGGSAGTAEVGRMVLGRSTSAAEREGGAQSFEGGLYDEIQNAMKSGNVGQDDSGGQAELISKFMTKKLTGMGVSKDETQSDDFRKMVASMVETIQGNEGDNKAAFIGKGTEEDQQDAMQGLMINLQDYAIKLQGRQTDASTRKGAAEQGLTSAGIGQDMQDKFKEDPAALQAYLDKIAQTGGQDWNTLTSNVDKFGTELNAASDAVVEAYTKVTMAVANSDFSKAAAAGDVRMGLPVGTTKGKVDQLKTDVGEKGLGKTVKDEAGKIAEGAKAAATSFFNGLTKLIPGHAAGGVFGPGAGSPAGSLSKGTDTRLAKLTPGEFVVNKKSTQENLGLLNTINKSKGGLIYRQGGGALPDYQTLTNREGETLYSDPRIRSVYRKTPYDPAKDPADWKDKFSSAIYFPTRSTPYPSQNAEQFIGKRGGTAQHGLDYTSWKLPGMEEASTERPDKFSSNSLDQVVLAIATGLTDAGSMDTSGWGGATQEEAKSIFDTVPDPQKRDGLFKDNANLKNIFAESSAIIAGNQHIIKKKQAEIKTQKETEVRQKEEAAAKSKAEAEKKAAARQAAWDALPAEEKKKRVAQVKADIDKAREEWEATDDGKAWVHRQEKLKQIVGLPESQRTQRQNLWMKNYKSERGRLREMMNKGGAGPPLGYGGDDQMAYFEYLKQKSDEMVASLTQAVQQEESQEGSSSAKPAAAASPRKKRDMGMNHKAISMFNKAGSSIEWLGTNVKKKGYSRGFGKLRKTLGKLRSKTLQGLADGGTVGNSMGNSDTVDAVLTPGEFVVNAQAAANNLPLLNKINNGPKRSPIRANKGGYIQRFNQGGQATSSPGASTGIMISQEGMDAMQKLSLALDNFSNSQSIPNLSNALNEFTRSFGQGIELKVSGIEGIEVRITGLSDLEGFAKTEVVEQIAEKLNQVASKIGVDGSSGRG